MRNLTIGAMAAILLFCAGCGTLFFSHRIGKPQSKVIDKRVFYSNCFLCLCGVIPGVVAFILDYENGTLYYTEAELLPDDLFGMKERGTMKKAALPELNVESAAAVLSKAIGKEISPELMRISLRKNNRMACFL